jgi:hypothetical protein
MFPCALPKIHSHCRKHQALPAFFPQAGAPGSLLGASPGHGRRSQPPDPPHSPFALASSRMPAGCAGIARFPSASRIAARRASSPLPVRIRIRTSTSCVPAPARCEPIPAPRRPRQPVSRPSARRAVRGGGGERCASDLYEAGKRRASYLYRGGGAHRGPSRRARP